MTDIQGFLPRHRAICVALLLLWLPVFALAQTVSVEMARGPLEDQRLRDAIMVSTDWMQAAKRTGLDVRSVIRRHADETDSSRRTPQDIERAKFLLREIGGVSGKTPLILMFDARTAKLAQLVGENLRRLRLPVKLVELPEGAVPRTQKMMRTRVDISPSEPGFILLTWNFAEILEPSKPDRDVFRPVLPADLEVSKFETAYDPGNRILTVRALVRNIGKGKMPSRFEVSFPERTGVIAGRLGRHVAGPLAAGGAEWVEARMRIDDAMLDKWVLLRAQIHIGPDTREINARNNTSGERRVLLERPPQPDLIIGQVEPEYDRVTRRLKVRVAVRNIGKATAGPSQVQIIETNRRFALPDVAIPRIAPGDTAVGVAEVVVPRSALDQIAMLEAMANPGKKPREANYANNGFGPVRVMLPLPPEPDQPDLVVIGFEVRYDPEAGEIAGALSVSNAGKAPARPFEVVVFDRTGFVEAVTLRFDGLAPGKIERRPLSLSVPAVSDPHMALLQAETDPDARVPESDDGNNLSPMRRVALEPPPERKQPDLRLVQLIAEYDAVRSLVVLRSIVKNIGNARSAATRISITELKNQMPEVDVALQALNSDEQTIVHYEKRLAPSSEDRVLRFLSRVIVDPKFGESRVDNNESQVVVLEIPAPPAALPDLVIDSLVASQARIGGPLKVTAKIINAGKADSRATGVVLRIDGADVGIEPLPVLRPKEVYMLRQDVPARTLFFGGTVEVAVEADPEGRIPEITRGNNLRLKQVALRPPLWPWIAVGGAGIAVLLLLWRLIKGSGSRPPETGAEILPVHMRLQPRTDMGRQVAKPDTGGRGIDFELSLRPRRDTGQVTVKSLTDTGETET